MDDMLRNELNYNVSIATLRAFLLKTVQPTPFIQKLIVIQHVRNFHLSLRSQKVDRGIHNGAGTYSKPATSSLLIHALFL
jgi:hypothetical protein